eukprot:TRINITY_DN9891_c0_g1_i1.p2 TRINITY_DN9891_c0_g1~~TRINITY_DN9891_c0_g1_i1.p2  ORF type:complete len:265 (-),score=45.55 TRINITY_DN9891_c0_g1_i1:251-979(-)
MGVEGYIPEPSAAPTPDGSTPTPGQGGDDGGGGGDTQVSVRVFADDGANGIFRFAENDWNAALYGAITREEYSEFFRALNAHLQAAGPSAPITSGRNGQAHAASIACIVVCFGVCVLAASSLMLAGGVKIAFAWFDAASGAPAEFTAVGAIFFILWFLFVGMFFLCALGVACVGFATVVKLLCCSSPQGGDFSDAECFVREFDREHPSISVHLNVHPRTRSVNGESRMSIYVDFLRQGPTTV